ncbi:unnamed protein product [Lathyrus sativus]|nr:unnamed protein product [Lathyrus sativus]
MLQVNKDTDEEVALKSCEFWFVYCDAQMPPENLREFLPRLIPILLSNMVYADDDESLIEAEEEGPSASRLHDLFLHQFCEAHSCSGCLAYLCGALHCDDVMNFKASRSKCNPAATAKKI